MTAPFGPRQHRPARAERGRPGHGRPRALVRPPRPRPRPRRRNHRQHHPLRPGLRHPAPPRTDRPCRPSHPARRAAPLRADAAMADPHGRPPSTPRSSNIAADAIVNETLLQSRLRPAPPRPHPDRPAGRGAGPAHPGTRGAGGMGCGPPLHPAAARGRRQDQPLRPRPIPRQRPRLRPRPGARHRPTGERHGQRRRRDLAPAPRPRAGGGPHRRARHRRCWPYPRRHPRPRRPRGR